MRKLALLVAVAGLTISTPIWAAAKGPVLNLVKYPVQVEGWAKTDTAKVMININASLKETALADLHQQMLSKLHKISTQGSWHITSFNQTKSSSGLETVNATAQARLPAAALASLRQKAKTVSTEGESYKVGRIDFSPSQMDIQAVKAKLREQVFQKVKIELANLNKVYSNQKFFVHSINFMPPKVQGPTPRPEVLMRTAGAPMQVSDKIIVTARVKLASEIS